MSSKIIDRMQRLLAMSQDNSSEHEAAIALRRLHALLVKYNMSLTDLDSGEHSLDIDSTRYAESASRPWKRRIAAAIAKLYFCRFYYSHMGSGKILNTIVGEGTNRAFALAVISSVIKTFNHLSRVESKNRYGSVDSSFVTSFLNGAASRVVTRCEDLKAKGYDGTLEDEGGGYLPVLASVYDQHRNAVDAWMNSKGIAPKAKALHMSTDNRAGYFAGQSAANNVQLSRAIQTAKSPNLIAPID